MNTRLRTLIIELHSFLEDVEPEERVQVFRAVVEDYCEYCGKWIGVDGVCHCQNNEWFY